MRVILTISAVWFLLRTALCRAVMPSFVLKSRCAPPLFSTLMSSAHPSSCAACVRGHSVKFKDEQAMLENRVTDIMNVNPTISIGRLKTAPQKLLKLSATHSDSCFGSYFSFFLVNLLCNPRDFRSSVTLQVTQQGNLLYGWTIICINLRRRLAESIIQLWSAHRRLISDHLDMMIS